LLYIMSDNSMPERVIFHLIEVLECFQSSMARKMIKLIYELLLLSSLQVTVI
jgi:hypothetical protein